MLHIGTDEAGYGPLLGPLVVAAAAFDVPGAERASPGDGIADSKAVYRRGSRDALARVLSPYLGLDRPVSLGGLLATLSVRGLRETVLARQGGLSSRRTTQDLQLALFVSIENVVIE